MAGSEDSIAAQALHRFGVGISWGLSTAPHSDEGPGTGGLAQIFLTAAVQLLEGAAARQRCQQQLQRIAAAHSLPLLTA